MLTLFVGESRNHVDITDTKDCLDCEVIRIENRVFVNHAHVLRTVEAYERRGFKVSVQYRDEQGRDVEYFTSEK